MMLASKRGLAASGLAAAIGAASVGIAYVSSIGRILHAPPADTIRIAAVAYVGSCPILMAQAKGYLSSEGVIAKIHFAENGKAALADTLRGDSDLATTADIPIMYAAFGGHPISVVATMASIKDHSIIGRRDRGVATPNDLRGKRIGVTMGTTTQFFLDAFLNRQRMSAADVAMIDLKPSELHNAIERGDVDAAVLYQPYLARYASVLKQNAAILNGEAIYDVSYTLTTTREYIRTHRIMIERVLRASIRGALFCRSNPDEASRRVAEIMSTDPETVRSIWSSYQFDINLRQGLLLTLEDEARWAIKNSLVSSSKMPNFLLNFGLAPLSAVSPGAVTVIH